jgi:hypothetical protein
MAVPHYASACVSSDDSADQMPYYRLQSKMNTFHYLYKAVHPQYCSKKLKRKILTYIFMR